MLATYQWLEYILFALTLLAPIVLLLILKKKDKHLFLNYIIYGSIISVVLALIYAGFSSYSTDAQLELLGFNVDAARESEKMLGVQSEHLDRVDYLRKSKLGLPWYSKALFSFVALGIPYLFTVYITKFAIHCLFQPSEQQANNEV